MSDDDQDIEDSDLGPEDEGVAERVEVAESSDDITVDASVVAKEAERKRIQAEIEAFLSKGGKITHVESNVMSDPPRRPESNYGGQPI